MKNNKTNIKKYRVHTKIRSCDLLGNLIFYIFKVNYVYLRIYSTQRITTPIEDSYSDINTFVVSHN